MNIENRTANRTQHKSRSGRSNHKNRNGGVPRETFERGHSYSPEARFSEMGRNYRSTDYRSEKAFQVLGEDFKAFPNRDGYDESFLGQNLPLPAMTAEQRATAAERTDKPGSVVLDYTNFSIVVDKERRQARFTAVNIDGAQYNAVKRKNGWVFDSRIPREYQLGDEAYGGNDIDRGHMVRRRAPMWGKEAKRASSDTFVFTNAGLQHAKLNQEEWLDLENRILNKARDEKIKMTVFTGPVFKDDDPSFDNRGRMDEPTQMPREFWKVVVWNDADKGLRSEAFVMSQKDDIEGRSGAVEDPKTEAEFQMYRVPLSELEAKTELSFGGLHNECESCTPIGPEESASMDEWL